MATEATPVGLRMWWEDTNQHALPFERWLARKQRDGLSYQAIADELADRTSGRCVVAKSTVMRWMHRINEGKGMD